MKKAIRCKACCNCGTVFPVGFTGEDRHWCIELARWVDIDDGCTFGEEGEGRIATVGGYDVNLEEHAAVYGEGCE